MVPPIVYALRVIHVLVALILSTCLFYLYYVVATGAEITRYAWGSIAAILTEGAVFFGHGRECPLSRWQRKFGDDKGFFELFMSPRSARAVLPVLLVTSAIPILLIVGRVLR